MESEGISVLGEKAERLGQKPVCRLVFPNLATADGNWSSPGLMDGYGLADSSASAAVLS